jgi:oligopeptide/dipeptide ABC transporter ATP-binding protein
MFLGQEGRDVDLVKLGSTGKAIRAIRGSAISMIFQEPMTSLSPIHSIGNQIMEAILLHRTDDRKEARAIALDMIERVGIPNPSQRIDEYPYQLSGGMRQRAMIAMALSCEPDILMADEPTTALDVTIQAQILELLKQLQEEFGMAVLFITHDLGVIAEISENVAVMYLGRIVESGSARDIFKNPLHPYTRSLLKSIPRLGRKSADALEAIKGTVPMPLNLPPMCGFCSRCEHAMAGTCDRRVPALVEMQPGHSVRCFLHSREAETTEGTDEDDRSGEAAELAAAGEKDAQ